MQIHITYFSIRKRRLSVDEIAAFVSRRTADDSPFPNELVHPLREMAGAIVRAKVSPKAYIDNCRHLNLVGIFENIVDSIQQSIANSRLGQLHDYQSGSGGHPGMEAGASSNASYMRAMPVGIPALLDLMPCQFGSVGRLGDAIPRHGLIPNLVDATMEGRMARVNPGVENSDNDP
jgi:hypothetical protein